MRRPKVRSKVRCDGKRVTWKARWVQDTCGECGKPNDSWADVAEPEFHVKGIRAGRWTCCGRKAATFEMMSQSVMAMYREAAEAQEKRDAAFFKAVERLP